MPSANKMTTPLAVDLPVIQGRYAELDDYTVGFESYPEDVDPAPLFAGLPEDRCQCPHWGMVQSGQITFRWADREETYGAGDAYYAGARPPAADHGRHQHRRVQPQRRPQADDGRRRGQPGGGGRCVMSVTASKAWSRPASIASSPTWRRERPTACSPPISSPTSRCRTGGCQAHSAEEMIAAKNQLHPPSGRTRVEKVLAGPDCYTIKVEERWADGGQQWYCREAFLCDLDDQGRITELSVYCTGDWDEARVAEHAEAVMLLRP